MANSPSPGPTTFANMFGSHRHLSATPPLSQQPLSRRDKKRSAIENRLKDITNNFTSNRDFHLRSQLNALSRDIQFINQADPYQNRPLDDGADDLSIDLSSIAMAGSVDGEARTSLGKFALQFVGDVNDAMEERDASLTSTHRRFTKQIAYFKMEHDFAIAVAEAEEHALRDAARSRVINGVQSRKKAIQKEKDLLDTADSNTILFSTSGFTITQPASPGGGLTSRKTRNTRHNRQDQDGLEVIDGKRKRKPPAEFENDSPAPNTRILMDTPTLFSDKVKTNMEHENTVSSSIERLFSTKELTMHYRAAHNAVAGLWAEKKQPNHSAYGQGLNGPSQLTNGDGADFDARGRSSHNVDDEGPKGEHEDLGSLVAPTMERTGSHLTRSTRNNHVDAITSREAFAALDDPQRVFGAAVIEAFTTRNKFANNKEIEAPLTEGLSAQERTEDLHLFERMLGDESY